MAKRSLGAYQKVQANTATPMQRVLMVYNGINKNLKIALEAFHRDDPSRFETINNAVQLAEKLIVELKLALDMANGGELAVQLNALYVFWLNHLSQGNREKEEQKIQEVQEMVQELASGWAEAEKQLKNS
ncbi:MAG: flagellar export chaperone FliS [Victivallales bacterium]|nr:flagellar export chaperone FliS [Victivallales bacterium]